MSEQDRRVFMYRGKEARLFNSPEEVPAGEGWRDHPHELDEEPGPSDLLRDQLRASVALIDAPADEEPALEEAKPAKKKGKKAAETEEPSEPVTNGDGN